MPQSCHNPWFAEKVGPIPLENSQYASKILVAVTIAQWDFGMKLEKKNVTIFSSLSTVISNNYKMISDRLKRLIPI